MNIRKIPSFHLWIIILCVLNILFRLPFSNLKTGLWDETNYIYATNLIANNNINPFIEFVGYKPPVMFMLPALLFRIFFVSKIFLHWQTYLFSSLAIYMTYLLGKKLSSEWVGFASALLLAFAPLFINQSFFFLDPIYLTALLAATMYFYVTAFPIGYVVCGSLLILTKEPSIFVPIAIFFFDILKQKINRQSFAHHIKKRLFLLLPLLPFIIWMLINKKMLGWYLWPFNTDVLFKIVNSQRTLTPLLILLYVRRAFIEYGLWIIWGGIIGGLVLLKNRKSKPNDSTIFKRTIFVIVLFVSYFLFFILSNYIHRYLLFLFPLLFITCCSFLERFLPSRKSLAVAFILCYFIGSNIYRAGWAPITWDGDNDLSLFRFINLHQKTIDYLTIHYPHATLYTDTSLDTSWSTPLYGFVQTPGKGILKYDPAEVMQLYDAVPPDQRNAVLVTLPDSDLDNFASQNLTLITTIRLPTLSKNVYDEMNIYQMPQ